MVFFSKNSLKISGYPAKSGSDASKPVLRIRIQRIRIILPDHNIDPDPDQNPAHFHHLFPPPSHLNLSPLLPHTTSLINTGNQSSLIHHPLQVTPHPLLPYPTCLTPPPSYRYLNFPPSYLNSPPSYLIRLPSSFNIATSPSPLLPQRYRYR